ncbi:tyrosine-type recombinase/integrase [Janthinobacterium fluminis]|uniref:Tyrosine-type recombinase/integrase n=1 Tax=Janthinobacterium fluminis TaxID=2987524 RepID=A0ABT5JU24_9BURK|nr:tyrosine-type recombinase/integrase [Janthinobacterium fluminis]MDC8756247.1 tyrosine-type recombinase/integrase [Janthinobacterium fluminis]
MSATLFRVKKVWHYRFQVDGGRVQRSTRERTRAKAEPVAAKAYADAVVRANGGQPVPTLDELFKTWLEVQGPVSSAAHVRSVDVVHRLHMYELGGLAVSDVTTAHIELARNQHLLEHKPATANHWLRVMKLIANWAVKRDIIARLPWRVTMLKVQKRPRATLPLDVAKAWFDAVDGACVRAPTVGIAVRLMFGLGLREGEAAGARWEWIDWQRATYTPGVTKGREAEPVPIPSWLVGHLAPQRMSEGLIAPGRDGAQQPAGFARKAMQVANAHCKVKGITPHRLRGTFATLLSEAGVPIQTIQGVMRHKSPMTTMAYLEKRHDTAALAQASIAEKIGFARRESGEHHAAKPHESSSS